MYRPFRGFTLIELLVVIAIIGMLSSIVLASLTTARTKARDANRQQTIHSIQVALELYYSTYGRYPAMTENECGGTEGYTLANNNFMASLVSNGYLPTYPTDPVAAECRMQYTASGTGKSYVIFVMWETQAQSGCIANAPTWSCVGVNPEQVGW